MHKADLTSRAVAGFIDFLLILGLSRLPDVLGILSSLGYLLLRDGFFDSQSVGKKLIGIRIASSEDPDARPGFRESIFRNTPFAVAFLLFKIPFAGWILGPVVLGVEYLTALGDERGMRIGDLLARTMTVRTAEPFSASPAAQEHHHPPDERAPESDS